MAGQIEFPIKQLPTLFHIGTLDPAQKKWHSYEGAGLSVSTVPAAWRRIARLPGSIFTVSKAEANFLNFHKMKKIHRGEIKSWGIQNGYVIEGTVYRVSWDDEEWGQTLCLEFTDLQKALEETEEGKTLRKANTIISTEKMNRRVLSDGVTSSLALDLLATIYADEVLGLDGVWWQDKLDINRLSAPRGCVFLSTLASWSITKE
jgi:hypothetical protein